MMCLQLRLKMSYSLCFIFHVSCCFISVGKTPASIKRRINQYPARLSGGLQSPTEINAQLHNAPQEHCYACIGTRGCAGIRFGRANSRERELNYQDTSYKPSAVKLFIQVPDELSIPCSNKSVNMFIHLFSTSYLTIFLTGQGKTA